MLAPFFVAAMLTGIAIVGIVFAVPLAMVVTYHRRKMEEIRLRRQGMISDEIRGEFAAVRSEIQALRDTAMQYDISFDTAIQRLERRLEQVERRKQDEEMPQRLGG